MEDYIFLIIAVALSIYAAINKNKKNKEAPILLEEEEELEENNARNFFMDQLLGEDFLEEPIVKKPKPVKIAQIPARPDFKSGLDMNKKGLFKSRFVSTLPERIKRPSVSSLNIQPEEVEENLMEEGGSYLDDFSLRKAVIYSQILERKY
ncbi:MAG: hypothetical protein Q7J86_05255 [Bacteroidota bacterium]|nr:hypothetical protein [Bacteroidota bacterium]MDO9613913.1 hypothetical protein [Bacteroidota bacterium]